MFRPAPLYKLTAAVAIAEQRKLDATAYASLVNWAERAENNQRWPPEEMQQMAEETGLEIITWEYSVGPGFALFAMARKAPTWSKPT